MNIWTDCKVKFIWPTKLLCASEPCFSGLLKSIYNWCTSGHWLGAASVPPCRTCHYLITIQDQRTAHCRRADEMHKSCTTLRIQSQVELFLPSHLHCFLIISFQIKFGKFEVRCVNVWHKMIITHQYSVHINLRSFESYSAFYGVMSWMFSL